MERKLAVKSIMGLAVKKGSCLPSRSLEGPSVRMTYIHADHPQIGYGMRRYCAPVLGKFSFNPSVCLGSNLVNELENNSTASGLVGGVLVYVRARVWYVRFVVLW